MALKLLDLFKSRKPEAAVPAGDEAIAAALQEDLAAVDARCAAAIVERDQAQAALTAATGAHTTALAAKDQEITDLKAAHTAALEEKEKSVAERASAMARDLCAEMGIPEDKLPKDGGTEGGGDGPRAELDALRTKIAAAKDPKVRGELAEKAAALRAKHNLH